MATITLRSVKGSPLTNTEVDGNFSALNTELGTKANSVSPSLTTPTLGVASATSIAASLGAVGAPSYTFTGDTNTGIFSPAADTLAFVEGGAEAMRITSAGDVGVGTTAPTAKVTSAANFGSGSSANFNAVPLATAQGQVSGYSFRSTFVGTADNGARRSADISSGFSTGAWGTEYLAFGVGNNGATNDTALLTSEKMRVTSTGNVGIGTTAPAVALDVAGTIRSVRNNAEVRTTTATGYGWRMGTTSSASTLGYLFFQGTTDNFATSFVDSLAISSAGYVGIGTTTPGARLNVIGHNEFTLGVIAQTSSTQTALLNHPVMVLGNTSVAAGNGLNLRYQIADTGGVARTAGGVGMIATAKDATTVTADMYFYTGSTEKMRILSGGNVGIGTTAPLTQLNVPASILVTSDGGYYGGGAYYSSAAWRNAVAGQGGYAVRNTAGVFTIFTGASTDVAGTAMASFAERLRIDGTGNVGIGTIAPGYKLDVSSSGTTLARYTGAQYSQVQHSDGTRALYTQVYDNVAVLGTATSTPLTFAPNNTERMRLDASGNLLVGATANPGVLNKSVVVNSGADSLAGIVLQNNATGTGSTDGSHITIAATDLIIANAENAATIFKTNNTERMRIASSGIVTAAIAFNAPVFNDSNDSNYYTNPFGTSNLLGLTVANTITGSVSGSAATSGSAGALYANTGAVSSGLQVWNEISNTTLNPSEAWHYGLRMGHGDAATYYSATLAIPFFSDSLYMRRKTGGTDNTWRRFWHNGDASITASTDFQSPVFKDSDNAAFYLDPAGTSNLYRLTLNPGTSGVTTGLYINGGDITATRNGTTGAIYLGTGSSSYIYFDGSSFEFGSAGFVTSSTSIRAPVFYNTPDTAFYVDPDATSVLSALTLGGRPTTNAVYYSGFSLDANTMAANSTGFTYSVNAPATGPIARLGDGGYSLQLNAPYAANGAKLFYRTRQGDAGTFNAWFSVATYDVNYGTGELYATKFSDAANSGYYLNPDSTSALYDAIVIGPNPSWAQYLRIGGNGQATDMATVAASNGNLHIDSKNNFHTYLNYGSNGQVYLNFGGGYTECQGASIRAPVFYDSVSTGYYLDAAVTSNLNAVLSYSYQGNGNVGGTGNASWHPSGVYSAGPNWLYGGIHAGGGDINNVSYIYASVFADRENSVYFLDPAGYSLINGNGSTAGSAAVGLNIYSTGGNGAIMAFHRGGLFAINMGLDSDNVFRIGGWSTAANRLQMDMSGNLTMAGNVTAYSDARLKENIVTVTDALNLVGRMRGVTYIRKDTGEAGVGVIAQEMLEILPQVVQQGIGDDDTLSVAYGNIVGVLIEAIKELENKVTTIESRLH